MPPTAAEIKARLEKAVDKEGNVLNMGAVHDIVTWLEQVNITKEALEATRVGRALNLMRKKTQNEDLAKRAKNLIKKWQVSVMNQHPKINVNGVVNNNDTNNRPNARTGSKELNSKNNETAIKTGVKRKRASRENSPLPLVNNNRTSPGVKTQQTSSPRMKIQQTSPKLRPQQTSSPRVKTQHASSPRLKPQQKSSPKVKTQHTSPGTKPSSPYLNKLSQKATTKPSSPLVTDAQKNEKLSNNHDRVSFSPIVDSNRKTTFFNKKNEILNDNHSEIKSTFAEKEKLQTTYCENKKIQEITCSVHSSPQVQKTDSFTTETPSDTRVQENRILPCSSSVVYTTKTNSLYINDKVFKPIDTPVVAVVNFQTFTQEENSNNDNKCFEPIEEEDLTVSRRELPEDLVSPDIPADGVNGVFNDKNEFREWTDEVVWRDKEYHILPYVILD